MTIVQLVTSSGGNMRKVIKRSSSRKSSRTTQDKTIAVELTASQRRLLQILVTGTEADEPSLLAGRP
ncbi:hypothetical protein EAH78_03700 [Pseudomonas arsenicoxydans]|uniref:Uncharacterized protein n=1 Tax=Pseudomonas arsenicoxydans TaxID=702115 RepID=A0A502I3V7_9PSED|nr:hypothetical protein EAH78_03700 [Pseudomonas arsenicoxydans]